MTADGQVQLADLTPEERRRFVARVRAEARAEREERELLPTAAPCPWCGSRRTLAIGSYGAVGWDGHQVACMSRRCHGATGPARRTVRGAIAAWNAREGA